MPHFLINNHLPYNVRCFTCSYFSELTATEFYTTSHWLNELSDEKLLYSDIYNTFIEKGYRRAGDVLYTNMCNKCNQCTPIRLFTPDFVPTKSQRSIYKKNQDLEVTIETDSKKFATMEKAHLYREYDFYHNGSSGSPKMTLDEAKETLTYMHGSYDGVINMEYRLNGILVGVAILDFTTVNGKIQGLSSNYFYYDVSDRIKKRSLGVFSVLKEIELCLKTNIPYYYLGLYLPECRKMNYKANYKPYELYINNNWIEADSLPPGTNLPSPGTTFPNLNPSQILEFPAPGVLAPQYPELCLVTEDIPLISLYSAYFQGIFPWFNEEDGDPVLWQSPAKRFVILPENFHISKSIKKALKKNNYTYTVNKCFKQVMLECQQMEREGQNSTWIGKKMVEAYTQMHEAGFAHSFEVWKDGKLAGGFYGLLFGSVFFGESMFTIEPDTSKTAFVKFATAFFANGGKMIDCQVYTDNMARYGAEELPREEFLQKERMFLNKKISFENILQDFFK